MGLEMFFFDNPIERQSYRSEEAIFTARNKLIYALKGQ